MLMIVSVTAPQQLTWNMLDLKRWEPLLYFYHTPFLRSDCHDLKVTQGIRISMPSESHSCIWSRWAGLCCSNIIPTSQWIKTTMFISCLHFMSSEGLTEVGSRVTEGLRHWPLVAVMWEMRTSIVITGVENTWRTHILLSTFWPKVWHSQLYSQLTGQNRSHALTERQLGDVGGIIAE